MPERVDSVREAALDQVAVRRPLGRRAKAPNQVVFRHADELREIGKRYVTTDVGIDIGEDSREMSRRERTGRGWQNC
jgi:hypothetical protein